MDADLQGMGDRIKILPDMDAVISALTEEVQASELSAETSAALNGLSQTIGELAIKLMRTGAYQQATLLSKLDRKGQLKRVTFRRWVAPPDAELLGVSNVTGHRINDSVWFIADVEWLLWGVSQSFVPNFGVVPVACIWETRVLMTTSGVERPTILTDRTITKPLPPERRDTWGPIVERVFGPLDELMTEEGQSLVAKLLMDYSEENRDLLSFIPTLIVDDEGGGG
ncbi:hypothetical protein CG723_43375 [Streptomyces sp. CB01635]|nr:hypothetical protein CG723_43375 [Streptomyces sp. CB01635]